MGILHVRKVSYMAILLISSIVLATAPPGVLAQPEPPSPEEEWYPPPPTHAEEMPYGIMMSGIGTVPAAGTLSLELIDTSGRIRTEFYGTERFCMRFVTPFSKFFIFLYEWYPPGNVPKGHWLIYGAGPFTVGVGTIINIGYFYPERGEPEGQHVWKCWLYDPTTCQWATGIVRFSYFKLPRALIERVDYPQELLVDRSYELKVYIKNEGEADYTYTVEVKGVGVSFPTRIQSVRIGASSTAVATFPFKVLVAGVLSVKVTLKGDGVVLDTKSLTLVSRVLKPGPMVTGDVKPTVLKEGEETTLVVTFVNRGQGEAKSVTARIEALGFIVVSGIDFSPDIPSGGSGSVQFVLRPLEGGRKTLKITITYADVAGNTYTDIIEASLLVLVRLRVEARSKAGTLLDIPMVVGDKEYKVYEDWIDPTAEISLEAPEVVRIDGTRYVFEHWSDGFQEHYRRVMLTKSATLAAIYRIEHYVSVESPYGEVGGSGWYEEGTETTISVEPTAVGFGIKYVFDHWEDEKGNVVSNSPIFILKVEGPTSLRAVWRTDYTELASICGVVAVAVIAASLLLFRKRIFGKRPTAPPPPPPPPSQ